MSERLAGDRLLAVGNVEKSPEHFVLRVIQKKVKKKILPRVRFSSQRGGQEKKLKLEKNKKLKLEKTRYENVIVLYYRREITAEWPTVARVYSLAVAIHESATTIKKKKNVHCDDDRPQGQTCEKKKINAAVLC